MNRKTRFGYLLLALIITLACVPALPAAGLLPTQPVGLVETIVAGTHSAAQTATARQVTPTETPAPTLTPSPTATDTPTATATIIFKLPTLVGLPPVYSGGTGGGSTSSTPTAKYSCSVVSVTPADKSHVDKDKVFTITWKVKNTGNVTWDHNSVDYKHVDGKLIVIQGLYDLPANVSPKKTIDLPVEMRTPNEAGTFSTTWTLRMGDQNFCSMKLTVIVP